jgi:hypothetical protein
VFQRLIRRWEEVHPYNAAQVLKVTSLPELKCIERAWSEAMETSGLGRVQVDGTIFRHEQLNGELIRYPVRVLPEGSSLAQFVAAELNRPFADPGEPPFRPFVVKVPDSAAGEPGGGHLGLIYQHWVADSVSIRLLLREWFVRIFDPSAARAAPVRHPKSGYWGLFDPFSGPSYAAEMAMSLLRRHRRYRRSRKVQTAGPRDYPVRVLLRDAPAGLVETLQCRARREGVKVNDLFLAALADVCNRFVPAQHRANRPNLAVGSVVDLRPHADRSLTDTFGLFLGFTEVVCRPTELRDFPRLLRCVARQTTVLRSRGVGQENLIWMLLANAAKRFVPAQELYHFYRKELPLMGGISNVNLNNTWAAQYHPAPLLEYLRISPTGPMVPLVFNLTTLGDRLHLSMTFREVLLDEAKAAQMADAFLERIMS